jgi:hypothetical protein
VANVLHYQCHGIVLNVEKERIVYWGQNHAEKLSELQAKLTRIDFPLDSTIEVADENANIKIFGMLE